MASILPVLLLGLFLQCTPSYSEQPCMLENVVGEGNFSITVSPHYYKPNTTYNVTISGMGNNVVVTLTAYMNGSSIGTWENENVANCAGVTGEGSLPITKRWTSPNDIGSYVKFSAYIMMGNETYRQNKTIKKASDNMNTSTTMTTHVYTNMTTMKNAGTSPMTTHVYVNMTSPTTNTTTPYYMTSTSTMMKTTTENAAGMVISFKPLHAFTCTLLLLFTAPELLL